MVKALDIALICSGSPGFLRSLGSLLAGRCRLMESYSIPDAAQMIHLHSPDYSIIDVRSCPPPQLARTFASISNITSGQAVLICAPGQLSYNQLPEEIVPYCRIIARSNNDEDYRGLADEILSPAFESREAVGREETQTFTITDPDSELCEDTTGEIRSSCEPVVTGQTPQNACPRPQCDATFVKVGSMAERFHTRTPELRAMLRRLEIAARHNVAILLIGETGSGKTHLASLIHEMSLQSNDRFLHVACGALPGELIESELFGHVKGSFTSAHADKDGKFLAAGNGTILLDEIDVLTPDQQVKLLRVIEKGEFEPVGSNRTHVVKARIIAASNLELQPLVEQGRFRPDLYYRLNTLSFTLPPLRKRMPDVEPLARYFVQRHAAQLGIEVAEITPEFMECLLRYPWPGNVREMENAIRGAVIYSEGGRMTADTLPVHVVDGITGPANDPSVAAFFGMRNGESLEDRIELTEKDIIEQALLNNKFSRTKTARNLGISRVTLYNKMRKYGIMPER